MTITAEQAAKLLDGATPSSRRSTMDDPTLTDAIAEVKRAYTTTRLTRFVSVPRLALDTILNAVLSGDLIPRAELAVAKQREAELVEAVRPFDRVGCELFAKNWNAGDLVFDGGPMRSDCLFFEDFLNLRAALATHTGKEGA